MKKIWLDTSFELKQKTGIGAYILTLINALEYNNFQYEIIACNWDKKGIRAILQFIWFNTVLYIKTLQEKPDIIIFPSSRMPILKRKGTEYITVVHDLAFYRPDIMSKYNEIVFKIYTKIAVKKADKLICVSETIKREIMEKFSNIKSNIYVVSNIIGGHFVIENKFDILKYNIESKKYILSVSTFNKNKNITELIRAFESISDKYPDIKMVLVGRADINKWREVTQNKNIVFTGYIMDEEIPVLYKNSLIYAFVSVYEGFGIPILEAQYSDTVLLCSDIPVFREVAGEGAEFCEPNSKDIAQKLEYLINYSERREELKKLGSKNLIRYSLENTSRQLVEVING